MARTVRIVNACFLTVFPKATSKTGAHNVLAVRSFSVGILIGCKPGRMAEEFNSVFLFKVLYELTLWILQVTVVVSGENFECFELIALL